MTTTSLTRMIAGSESHASIWRHNNVELKLPIHVSPFKMKYQQYSPRDLLIQSFWFSSFPSSNIPVNLQGFFSMVHPQESPWSPGVSDVGWSFLLWLWRHWQLEREADPQTAASTWGFLEDVTVMMIGYFRNILVAFKGLFQDFHGMGWTANVYKCIITDDWHDPLFFGQSVFLECKRCRCLAIVLTLFQYLWGIYSNSYLYI